VVVVVIDGVVPGVGSVTVIGPVVTVGSVGVAVMSVGELGVVCDSLCDIDPTSLSVIDTPPVTDVVGTEPVSVGSVAGNVLVCDAESPRPPLSPHPAAAPSATKTHPTLPQAIISPR
jgi:hypothetical protein